MENNWKKIAEWSALNEQLEKIWSPGYELMARRNAIERDIPWLKGHGASPSGPNPPRIEPLPPQEQEMKEVAPPAAKKMVDGRPPGERSKKKSKTQQGLENLPVMNHPRSSDPFLPDQSQSFQGDPSKKINN